jgi:hypothetical protein
VEWSCLEDGNWWARNRWLDDRRATTIVCFEDSVGAPGSRHPVWRLLGLRIVVWRGRGTPQEKAQAWDFPVHAAKSLPADTLATLIPGLGLPFKVRSWVGQRLGSCGLGLEVGGCWSFGAQILPTVGEEEGVSLPRAFSTALAESQSLAVGMGLSDLQDGQAGDVADVLLTRAGEEEGPTLPGAAVPAPAESQSQEAASQRAPHALVVVETVDEDDLEDEHEEVPDGVGTGAGEEEGPTLPGAALPAPAESQLQEASSRGTPPAKIVVETVVEDDLEEEEADADSTGSLMDLFFGPSRRGRLFELASATWTQNFMNTCGGFSGAGLGCFLQMLMLQLR